MAEQEHNPEYTQEFNQNSNDQEAIGPVARAASAASIVTAGFGFPNIWKNLSKNYPAGVSQSLLSFAIRKEMTSAELSFVLGKAAIDMHKDPAIIGGLAKDALERDQARDIAQRADVMENERLKQMIDLERKERSSVKEIHQGISKGSLFDRVKMVEQEINQKKGTSGFRMGSAEVKKNVILDIWRTSTNNTFQSMFPDLSKYSYMESKEIPLELYNISFDRLMQEGGVASKNIATAFLNTAINRNREGILAFTYRGNPVTLSNLNRTFVSPQQKAIKYNLDPNFIAEKRHHEKFDEIRFGRFNPVNDVLDSVQSHFKHLGEKEYGQSMLNMRGLIQGMYEEINQLSPEAREGKQFGVRVDPNSNSLVVFAQHDTFTGLKESSVRIPLPTDKGMIHFSRTNRTILTSGVTQHGKAVSMISSFERTTHELSRFTKALVHGTYTEPRDGENISLQSSVNKLYIVDRPTGNPLTDFSKSKISRSYNPWMKEHGRMRMNRISGLTQHNVLAATQKMGRDILMYDQEFIAGREGPQIVAKNGHLASPYQISYRKMSSSGRMLDGGTIYIKTDKNQKAIDAWKRGDINNLDLIRFKTSLNAIGKGSEQDIASIINEIETKGISATEAYDTVFNKIGKGSLVADFGGQGGPDREIIKFQTGIDYLSQTDTIDIYKMLKAGSSTKLGWSLQRQFKDHAESSTDMEFKKLESAMLNNGGSIAHSRMIDEYKKRAQANPHNKRQIMIDVAKLHGHDASVDTAMQCVLLDKIMSNKPLLGVAGSGIDILTRLQNNPSLRFRDKINLMNQQMLAAHFYGDPSRESDGLNNILPTTRSDRQIITGGSPGVGATTLDFFEVGNTGLKQVHQKFYGIKLLTPDKVGKFYDPFVHAFRKHIDHIGSNAIGDNIAINSESVMTNVLLTPQGYGDFYDGSIIAEKNMLKTMRAERELGATKILLGKHSGEIKDSRIADFIMEVRKKYEKPGNYELFKGDYLGTKEFNDMLKEHIEETKVGIAKDMENGLIDAGDSRYSIKQNDVIARNFMSRKKMVHGEGRFSALSFYRNNSGALELEYNIAQLVGLEKTVVGGTKSVVHGVESIGNFFKRDWEVAGEVTKDSLRPTIVAPYTMFKRGEFGTAKKIQVMRIYSQMLAGGHKQKATNFLQSITNKQVEDGPTGPRVKIDHKSVQQNVDALNLISEDKLYKGMIDAGLTWNDHDIKLMAEHYKINYTTEAETANEFDRVTTEIWEKANGKFARPTGKPYTEVLNSMMDNNALQSLRAIHNPFFHKLEKRIVNPLHTPTARYFDPTVTERDGKRDVALSIRTAQTLESIVTHHSQVPGTRYSLLTGTQELDRSMNNMTSVWEKSFTRNLLNRHVGSFKHRTRTAALRYLSVQQGTSAVEGKKISMQGLDVLLRRTLAHKDIIEDLEGELDISTLNSNVYNDYMKTSYQKETSEKYIFEAEALEAKAETTPNLNGGEKLRLQQEAAELRRHAGEIQTKPTMNYNYSPSEDNIRKLSGTLFEKIDRNKYTKEFGNQSNMTIDGQDIAPHDLLLIQAKGVSNIGNKKMWASLLDEVKRTRESMGASSPKVARKRAQVNQIIDALSKFVEVPGSDLVALPTPQLVTDIANFSVKQMGGGVTGWKGITKAYTGVLTALNELSNAKGGFDTHKKRVEDTLQNFNHIFINSIIGKKIGSSQGLLYGQTQYQLHGIRGLIQSPYAAILSVEEQLRKTPRDTKVAKGELPMSIQIEQAKLLQSGQYGFIDIDSFNKMPVGDIPVKDFLKRQLNDDVKYKRILTGIDPIPVVSLRNPLDTGTQNLFPVETYIYNTNNRLFKNMPKGLVPSLKFLLKGIGDTDGDEMGMAMLNTLNIQEFNKVLAETRLINKRENDMISDFHQEAFKTGDYKTAGERIKEKYLHKDLHGVKVNESELHEALHIGKQFLEDYGHHMKKDPLLHQARHDKEGYTLERLNVDQRLQIGKASVIEATKQALDKYSNNIVLSQHIQEAVARAQIQNIGKSGIGLVSSYATRTGIRLSAVSEYVGRLTNATDISSDLMTQMKHLGLFSDADFKNPARSLDKFRDIVSTYKEHSDNALARIERILRNPEQHLISTKKQIDPKAGEMMMSLVLDINNIGEDRNSDLRNFWGLDFTSTQLSALREGHALHKAIYASDALYRTDVDRREASTSHNGISIAEVEQYAADSLIRHNVGKLGATEIAHLNTMTASEFTSKFAEKTASAWRDSAKQLLYQSSSKSLMGMGIGLTLLNFGNPNQLSGGISDFGIDLGHRPGFNSESGVGSESLSPEPGQDVFTKKWSYLLKHDPILKDNMDSIAGKSYKDLAMNKKAYLSQPPSKRFKRNYIDYRKEYNSRYETNDMRRARMGS